MPPPRRKKRVSAARSDDTSLGQPGPSRTPRFSPPARKTPLKSPLRRVLSGGVTKTFKTVEAANLDLEITERARKLRAMYTQRSRILQERIEMRINRIPKKLWKVTMGELLAQTEGKGIADPLAELGGVKRFVEDVRRESHDRQNSNKIVVPKSRTTKKAAASSAREQMPPPPLPPSSNFFSSSPSKFNVLLSSSSPQRSSSPRRPLSPVKVPLKTTRAKNAKSTTSSSSASTRSLSRATTRSSLDTAATSASEGYSSTRGTKSSQAKAKVTTNAAPGLKRGTAKGAGSNGSLKENKGPGVKKPAKKEATASTGRVLRSRK